MRLFLVTLLCSLAACLPLEDVDIMSKIEVFVREVEVGEPGHRSKREAGMPGRKKFEFHLKNQTVELDLELNNLVRNDVNMYVTENGITKLLETNENNTEQYGYYQDKKTKASVMVKCNKMKCIPTGTFSLKGRKYRLDPNGDLVESTHFVIERRPNPEHVNFKGDMKTKFEYINPADGSPLVNGTEIESPTTASEKDQQGGGNGNHKRVRRAIPAGVDIIELFIYTDDAIYARFRGLYSDSTTALAMTRQYYSLICNEMSLLGAVWNENQTTEPISLNDMYKLIVLYITRPIPHKVGKMDLEYQQVKDANSDGIDIRIYFKGIHVALDFSGARWSRVGSNGELDASKALELFSVMQKNFKRSNNLQYDHAMAMSGKPFKGGTVGIAWVNTVCSSDSTSQASLIEDRDLYLALVAVHELGHCLSSHHDPSSGTCSGGFIMGPSIYIADEAKARRQHEFSSCSINAFVNKLKSLGSNRCTLRHSFTDAEYTAYRSKPIGGEELSLDEQCQVYFGAASSACNKGNDMCYRGIYCQTSTGCDGRLYLVLNHSPCQQPSNKWCFRGLCVDGITSSTSTTTDAPTTNTATPTTNICTITVTCERLGFRRIAGNGCCTNGITTGCCKPTRRTPLCSVERIC